MLSSSEAVKISVVGIGYVGSAVSALLARNNIVTAIDIDPGKVDRINEADLGISSPNLKATTDLSTCMDSEYVIIATPTDYDTESSFFDCSSVENVLIRLRDLPARSYKSQTIVIKSTVPIGYTDMIRQKLGMDNIICSPEFLRETSALYDCLHPDRIVIGCSEDTEEAAHRFAELITASAAKEDIDVLFMSFAEAEATKLFSNTYLALRVSFFNELDTFSEIKGLDPSNIIKGICKDTRIGDHYNNPSFGYGGYCLPKDTKQLLANYKDIPEHLISAIVDSNQTRKEFIANRIIGKALSNDTGSGEFIIGVFRLIMKAGSDNFRHSSVLDVMNIIRDRGLQMIVYEPGLKDGSEFCGATVVNDLDQFKKRSSLIIANRFDPQLSDVRDKIYSRDLFMRE